MEKPKGKTKRGKVKRGGREDTGAHLTISPGGVGGGGKLRRDRWQKRNGRDSVEVPTANWLKKGKTGKGVRKRCEVSTPRGDKGGKQLISGNKGVGPKTRQGDKSWVLHQFLLRKGERGYHPDDSDLLEETYFGAAQWREGKGCLLN